MELRLIRHGQPEWERDGLGVDDPPLTEIGVRQAEALGELFRSRDERIDVLLASPLVRAQQTAQPIAEATGCEVRTLDWLAEIHSGRFHGTPIEAVEAAFEANRGRPVDELWDGMPDGESFRAFHERVAAGAAELLATHGARTVADFPPMWDLDEPERRVVVVAHAGTNAVLLGALLGIPPTPWEWERFVTTHASVSTLAPIRIGGAWALALERLSDVHHLDESLRTR